MQSKQRRRKSRSRSRSPHYFKSPSLKKSHSAFKRGDHIYRPLGGVFEYVNRVAEFFHVSNVFDIKETGTHHGIYIGNNQVIHFIGGTNPSNIIPQLGYEKDAVIKQTSLEEFAGEYPMERVKIVNYKGRKVSDIETVIARAKRNIGQDGYHLFLNNCEHFAYWCKTGKFTSKQAHQVYNTVKNGLRFIGINVLKTWHPDLASLDRRW